MKKKLISVLLATAMVATTLAGCGSSSTDTATEDDSTATESTETTEAEGDFAGTISFGAIAPKTGSRALYGEAASNSVELALADINAAGGVTVGGKAYKFECAVFADDKSDSTEAVSAYNNCVSKDICAVIGSYASSCTKAFIQTAQDSGMLVITPMSTNATICKTGDYIFRSCFSDENQGPAMAEFVTTKLAAKKAAVIYATDQDYCTGLYDSISKYFEDAGLEYVVYECTSTDTDYSAQCSKAVSEGCDVIVYPNYLDTVPMLVQQAREAGFTGAIVGGDGWDGTDTTGLEDAFNNTYYTNHLDMGDTSEVVQAYVKEYTDAYGEDTLNATGALFYDTVYMLKDAIEAADSYDPAKIKDALATLEFSGVTGDISFDENGDPIKAFTIETFKDGKLSYFDKVGGK